MKNILWLALSIFFLTGCSFSQPVKTQTINNQVLATTTQEIQAPSVLSENLVAHVPILIYHHVREITDKDSPSNYDFVVSPQDFDWQMKYLSDNGFNSITVSNLADYFAGKYNLPDKPIIITFDDGLENQYQNVFPILKKYNLVATFYIFTNPISHSQNYMTWEQLAEIKNTGSEIGSHGHYHLYLDRITQAELEKEIVGSKEIIEEKLQSLVKSFDYPFGVYSQAAADLIKQAGYSSARGIINGLDHKEADLYKLKGYFITSDFKRFERIVNQ